MKIIAEITQPVIIVRRRGGPGYRARRGGTATGVTVRVLGS